MRFLIEIVESIVQFFTSGNSEDRRRLKGAGTGPSKGDDSSGDRADARGRDASEAEQQSRDEAAGKRPLERLAVEHEWEYLDSSESPPDAGPEIRGSIEDRAMRAFRDADGGTFTVQMPVREFQGAIVYTREPGQTAATGGGASKPDWARDGGGVETEAVPSDIEAGSHQSRTLFENLPDELRDRFVRLMRENGVHGFVINADRTEMIAIDAPTMYSGEPPGLVADEMLDVAHQITSMAEAGEAGSIGPGEQHVGEGMIDGKVFEKVTCEYCQTEFQAINRHKCPNCGAPVRGD